MHFTFKYIQSKEKGKDLESLQSSTTPDQEHDMGKWQNTRKHNTQEIKEVSPFPQVITQTMQHNIDNM